MRAGFARMVPMAVINSSMRFVLNLPSESLLTLGQFCLMISYGRIAIGGEMSQFTESQFRFVIPQEQREELIGLAVRLGLPPKVVYSTCAAIGVQFFRLSLNPSRDILDKALGALQDDKEIETASKKGLAPLKKELQKRASKKKK